jgi:peptidoglycan/LPS O-acetylase OafA/YrhL
LRGVLLLAGMSIIVVVSGQGYWSQFHLASPLPLKLPVFLAGICIAMALRASDRRKRWLWSTALVLVALPLADRLPWWATVLRVLLAAGLIALIEAEIVLARLRDLFACPVFRFLGDTSYGVYLTHLPCVIFGLALIDRLVPGETSVARFWLTLLVALPPTYGLAWCGCRFVERPGIRVGKYLLSYWRVQDRADGRSVAVKG